MKVSSNKALEYVAKCLFERAAPLIFDVESIRILVEKIASLFNGGTEDLFEEFDQDRIVERCLKFLEVKKVKI